MQWDRYNMKEKKERIDNWLLEFEKMQGKKVTG